MNVVYVYENDEMYTDEEDSWEPDEEELSDILVAEGLIPEYYASNYIPSPLRRISSFCEAICLYLKLLVL